jgi:hypothetical protein
MLSELELQIFFNSHRAYARRTLLAVCFGSWSLSQRIKGKAPLNYAFPSIIEVNFSIRVTSEDQEA